MPYTVSGGVSLSGVNTWTGSQNFQGGISLSGSATRLISIGYGTIGTRSEHTPNSPVYISPSNSFANSVIICEAEDMTFNFSHALATDPTVFFHSHNQSTTQWLGITHNATDGVISTGTGGIDYTGSVGTRKYDRTITTGGTTGAQTINKTAGTVNFAAAATTLVVTNNLVTTSSIVFAVIRTNDSTATIKNVVCAAGSFTITLTAAATAETSVGFFVTN